MCYIRPVPRAATTLALLVAVAVLDLQARDRSVVNVQLTTAPSVTPAARMALMREATGIWARAGVQLKWVSPNAQPEGLWLRVMTIERTGPAGSDDAALLGEPVRGAVDVQGRVEVVPVAVRLADQLDSVTTLGRGSLRRRQPLRQVLRVGGESPEPVSRHIAGLGQGALGHQQTPSELFILAQR